MNEDIIQKFGFSEMYEWREKPEPSGQFGRFVQFSKDFPHMIEPFHEGDYVLGVSTICTTANSDDPDAWHMRYLCNEFGDRYLTKEYLAVGRKNYDQQNEFPYIQTARWEHLIQVENPDTDTKLEYKKRTQRPEWVRVNLIGKVIVIDNGKCSVGGYCQPYTGKLKDFWGTAVPYDGKNPNKYYVLNRVSKNTVLIVNK